MPIVLLHPSPMSSLALLSLAHALLEANPNWCVIAFDTPGFGHSSALSITDTEITLADFADAIFDALSQLGIAKATIYGAATGAQIAIEMATRAPERVHLLIADGACHFEPAQRAHILANYFPSLEPVASGTHLLQAAHMARALFEFFPWFETTDSYRLPATDPNWALLHGLARQYLSANPSYDLAYRLAFENERAEQLAKLSINTWITRWPNSILLRYTDALLSHALPPNVNMLAIEAGRSRYAQIAQHSANQLKGVNAIAFTFPIHPELVILDVEHGSAVLSRQHGANSVALADCFLHLPGLGLGEFDESISCGLDDWKQYNQALVEESFDSSFGTRDARLAALQKLHDALDQQPALAIKPHNLEFLHGWHAHYQNALMTGIQSALAPAALQAKLNATLDLAQLKARLLEPAI